VSLVRRCKPFLGTYVEITVSNRPDGSSAIDAAFALIEKLQAAFNFYHETSCLSRLNRERELIFPAGEPHFGRLLETARDLFEASAATFCPFVTKRSGTWQRARLTRWPLGQDGPNRLYFIDEDVCLDLGGIAKGYVVDCAFEMLAGPPAECVMVNAGGDLRLAWNEPLPITVRSPRSPSQVLCTLSLLEGALATSCAYRLGGQRLSPGEFDIQGGSHKYASVSVLSSSCALSDGLTKCVTLSGNASSPLLNRYAARALVA